MKKIKTLIVFILSALAVASISAETTWRASLKKDATLTVTDEGRVIIRAPGLFLGISSYSRASAGVDARGGSLRTVAQWSILGGTKDVEGQANVRVLDDQTSVELPESFLRDFVKMGPRRISVAITPPAGEGGVFVFFIGGPESDAIDKVRPLWHSEVSK